MTAYLERNGLTILSATQDSEGDPLAVVAINGSASLVSIPLPLSIGVLVTVIADGSAIFDDVGFTLPDTGDIRADSLIATVSDGINEVSVSVNLQFHVPL